MNMVKRKRYSSFYSRIKMYIWLFQFSHRYIMKALLLNPHKQIPISFSITQTASPPLGLAYIAAVLEKRGYDVTVIDCIAEAPSNFFPFTDNPDIAAQGIDFDDLLRTLKGQSFDLIGVTVMFANNWLVNRHLINILKISFPDALVIAGGEQASAAATYSLLDCEGLDMVVIGEGEETISEVAFLLESGISYENASGIAYKKRDVDGTVKVEVTPRRERIVKLDVIPEPAWHLFPLDKYFEHDLSYGVAYGNSLPLFATRGCPYQCTFCSSPLMWGTKYSMRNPVEVVAEIKKLNTLYNVTNIDFYDLTAIIKRQWILDFCDELKKNDLNITWQIPAGTRIEVIDYEVALALSKSGCKNITYAPESGSPRMLKEIKKKVKLDRMLNSIKESNKAGLNIKLNMIMGYPQERFYDILLTYKFLIQASYYGAVDTCPAIFSPYPGSQLFDELEAEGKLTLDDAYFERITFSESFHKFQTYNRHMGKFSLLILLYVSYLCFYISNYIFRPGRLYQLFKNLYLRKYETRGEYMLSTVIKRNKSGLKQKGKTKMVTT